MKNPHARILSCIISVVFIMVTGLQLPATSYYVATNGVSNDIIRDGQDPTSSWQTITYALMHASSGDVINVDAGEYAESLYIATPVTINGTNSYIPSNPGFLKHVSATIIRPTNTSSQAVIDVATNEVTLQNLTIDGDIDTNGIPDVMYGIYSTNRPIFVNHCIIRNINGFGIACLGSIPVPTTNDTDAIRSYFGYNLITNITSTNAGTATGIYLRQAPATCEFNEIGGINGNSTNTGIYIADCKYTIATSNWIAIRSNSFDRCTTAIWANQFGGTAEKIIISGNNIDNGVVGIRVTAAKGQSLILSNNISVSGVSPTTNATPARGIWVQADRDPWGVSNTLWQTDHLVSGNLVSGASTGADNTVGMLFTYDTTTWTNINGGVRATVLNNSISGFDYGAFISSGTNDVSFQHNPLVRISIHSNDIVNNFSYGLFATGITEMVDASNNWWGSYFGPTGTQENAAATNAISTNTVLYSWPLGAYLKDSNGNGTNDWLDPDDDGDGISDSNEMASGISPTASDSDMDHLSDYAELIAGTDPTNPLSYFHFSNITMDPASSWPELTWESVTGRTYSVYRLTNLLTGVSLRLTNNIPPNYPAINVYTDTTATGNSPYFYRISVTN